MNRSGQHAPRVHRSRSVRVPRLRNTCVDRRLRHAPRRSLMRELVQPAEAPSRHPHPSGVLLEYERSRHRDDPRMWNGLGICGDQGRVLRSRRMRWRMRRFDRPADRPSRIRRLSRRIVPDIIHAVPVASRHPAPPAIRTKRPRSKVIRSPCPRIRRHPRVPRWSIPSP